ncbi:hypothetical protein CLV28_2772 [Sediminihabitans luteus]|uniref:Uncharacterized protein n=1 Tax=Sediminihabitans luteus TaxID=1138585 RepID=A0A2M9CC56_9CELL|nr:hypothetical protein [Sediminihabitans luteus]PJJ68965.1 hypothetical protein CLV28_2772 [Sediminihabitans luteus]GII99348.1 hypothetical protein Slu03_17260 [Sediminihabitans luteus]
MVSVHASTSRTSTSHALTSHALTGHAPTSREHATDAPHRAVDLTAPGLTIEHLVALDIEAFSARAR